MNAPEDKPLGESGRDDRHKRSEPKREQRSGGSQSSGRDGSTAGRETPRRDSRPTYGDRQRSGERDARPSYGDRQRSGQRDSRPNSGDRNSRPSYGGSRPASGEQRGSGEQSARPSYSNRGEGRDGRPANGDRDSRPSSPGRDSRPSYGRRDSKPSYGSHDSKPTYRDRTRGGERDSRPSYGDRQRSGDRDSRPSYSERPGRPERSERGGRPGGDRQQGRPGFKGRPDSDDRSSGPRTPRAVDRSGSSGPRNGPAIPDEVQFSDLGKEARAPLRTLSKDNAETVGRHLAMVVQLIDSDPELAYEHAQAAVRSGGRVDVVREAAGLCAYRTGRYAEALRELRTVRRLNGSSEHLPIMADCERGLERPARAIALAASAEAETLDAEGKIELAIVVSGARMDLGEPEAAQATLDALDLSGVGKLQQLRVLQAKASIFEATGRKEEAEALLKDVDPKQLADAIGGSEPDEEVIVYDLFDTAAEAEDENAAADENPAEDKPEENQE